MENKTFTKKEVFNFLKEKYNPDKTTIELADLWDFFSITEKDILDDTLNNISSENKEFDFGTLRCKITDDGWLSIKQDAEPGNPSQDIGVGKADGKRFEALDNAVKFMKDKFASHEVSE